MLGTFVFDAGYKEDYYKKSQQVRRIVQDKTNEILKDFDFILSPTTPHTSLILGKKLKTDPTVMYLEDIFTVHKYYWKSQFLFLCTNILMEYFGLTIII